MSQLLVPLLLLAVSALGVGGVLTIHDANEFIEFSNNVSNGMKYSGTTVFLDADLDFSGGLSQQFEPVGKGASNCFLGTFDGQGHTISNLAVTSPSNNVGVFGYSRGLTIRNVVIDGTCSFTSDYAVKGDIHVGGIIGYYYLSRDSRIIENSVNMGSVTFNGDTTGNSGILNLGGIVGCLSSSSSSSSYPIFVKNCANYGSVTHSGQSTNSYIGGIVGHSSGSSSNYVYIQNCLNSGIITHDGTAKTKYLYIGGIAGYNSYTSIENCVSAGGITSTTASGNSIGSIVGNVSSTTNITHSFWTSDVGCDKASGAGSSTPNIDNGTFQFEVNASLVDSLNSYSARNSTWTGWLLNANNASVAFRVNGGRGFAVKSQVVLLPSPADNSERTFGGWYSDKWLTAALEGSSVESDTTLYGMFCGSSNYTVTLDVDGWDGLAVNSIAVKCNGTYAQLPDDSLMERSGYVFVGWFSDANESVTNETSVYTPSNHTLHARWEEVTAQVEIVFEAKNLNSESVIETLKQYTGADFTIISIGGSDGGEGTRVIIKFTGKDDAENFVEKIRASSDSSGIKRVSFIQDDGGSFSPLFYPAMLSIFLVV